MFRLAFLVLFSATIAYGVHGQDEADFTGIPDYITCDIMDGDGVGGTEKDLGLSESLGECYELVTTKEPTANGMTFNQDIVDGDPYQPWKCYAEFLMTGTTPFTNWQTCYIVDSRGLPSCDFQVVFLRSNDQHVIGGVGQGDMDMDEAACAQACAADQDCMAADWNSGDGFEGFRCFFHSALPEDADLVPNDKTSHFSKSCSPIIQP